jgi:putative tryptophan/tyrosine transport system substrate-binding protein
LATCRRGLPRYASEIRHSGKGCASSATSKEKNIAIVAEVTQASLAAKGATTTIPIVIQGVSDPIGTGLVVSLARPGANITGTSGMSAEVVGKSLQLLKEVVPNLSRVAVLWNPDNAIFQAQMLKETQIAAGALGVEPQAFAARDADELERAFAAISTASLGALLVLADPIFILHRAPIVNFAEKSRLPTMYGTREFITAGGLMAYGPDYNDLFRRAAPPIFPGTAHQVRIADQSQDS